MYDMTHDYVSILVDVLLSDPSNRKKQHYKTVTVN